MSEQSFPIAHARMLVYEGGYSNHPADPGGVTLQGVTQERYNEYRRWKRLPQRALTKAMLGTAEWIAERDEIYRKFYWIPPHCPELPPGVDAAIYDYGVNSGPGRASKVLQRLVGVAVDGKVGPLTLEAVGRRDPAALTAAICDERLAFMKSLKTWPVFGAGWGRRVADVKDYSVALAASVPAVRAPLSMPDVVAKAEVPEPTAVKAVIKASPPAAAAVEAARDGAGWADWIAGHPLETAMAIVVVVAAAAVALSLIEAWRRAKQDAPAPGIGVVPAIP